MRAVDNRNRCAPVTLTGNQPVTQTVVNFTLTKALRLSLIDNAAHGLVDFHTGEFAGVHQYAVLIRISSVHFLELEFLVLRLQRQDNGQVVLLGKHPVALVTGGHAHNRAGTIISQHVVGHPKLSLVAVERIDSINAGKDTFLLRLTGSTFHFRLIADFITESLDFRSLRIIFTYFFHERIFGSQSHESNTISRIGTGGVDGKFLIQSFYRHLEFKAFAAANPVVLHGLNTLRPAFELVEVF